MSLVGKGSKNFYSELQAKRKEMKQRKNCGVDATEKQAPQKLQNWWAETELTEQEKFEIYEQMRSQMLNDRILKNGQLAERLMEGKTKRAQPLRKIAVVKKAERQMRKAQKSDPMSTMLVQDFMPFQTEKSGKGQGNKIYDESDFWSGRRRVPFLP